MTREWTAPDLFRISGAYWAGCALQAGVQLELFTALAKGLKREADLAGELDCEPRALGMLLTALVSMGLLKRENGLVSAPQSVLALLARDSPEYHGFIIKHHANIMPNWARLAEAVRDGSITRERTTINTESLAEREDFLMGMFNVARLQADRVARSLDLGGRQRLIDIGGGPGTYAIYFCRENPQLRATIFDLPTTRPFAGKTVARFGLEDRIDFAGGDFSRDPLPAGYDVAWISQVLHGEDPESAAALIHKASACLNPGGLLCVQEFVLDDDRGGPEHAALFALNMLVQTPGGQAYTSREIGDMLRAAGASGVRALDVVLPQSCRVLMGTMP
jgi:SAM-dependent methyltransferase